MLGIFENDTELIPCRVVERMKTEKKGGRKGVANLYSLVVYVA
jgi:hypothetical protein